MRAALQGLTLLEVLASLVLLSMMAATCVPLLQQSMRIMHNDQAIDCQLQFDFAQAVETALENPASSQIETWEAVESVSIPWPEQPERELIAVSRLPQPVTPDAQDSTRMNGHWLSFSSERIVLYRWVPASENAEQEQQQ